MKINDLFHGFRVRSVTHLEEIHADMWRMEYEKNGADLIWFDREDANANMTFGIAFKTVPEDDTGVFHIIEHSVLCGSDKYPVKEPFVDLIKGSVNTFLNAFTYSDKTVYPVCSRNKKDFLNLMDVYLDAVFHPLSRRNPLAFWQEGWHYEFNEDGTPKYNGVVYNEMKGAYANPDRILYETLTSALFPDTCYSKESGGHPEHIAELTYEQYLAAHKRFYSASNSRIFLDGKLDPDNVFAKLDEFLSEQDRIDVDADIPMQKPVRAPRVTAYYPIGKDECRRHKTQYSEGRVFGTYADKEKCNALALIFNALCSNDAAPLKKAVLDSGLCEDMYLYTDGDIQQVSAMLEFRNTDQNKIAALRKIVNDVLREQIAQGIDKDELDATLDSWEYGLRVPNDPLKGLSNGLDALNFWLYGGDPAEQFHNFELVANLRKKIHDGSRYYETLLEEAWFGSKHTASVVLVPSKTLGDEQIAAEAERAKKAAAGWSRAERKMYEDNLAELQRFQKTEDAPAAKATLPKLRRSDLTEKATPVRAEAQNVGGIPVLRNKQDSNGVIRMRLLFSMDDLNEEELHEAEFLRLMWGDTGNANHSTLEMMRIQKRDFGDFYSTTDVYRFPANAGGFCAEFSAHFALLAHKLPAAEESILETMFTADYTKSSEIINHLHSAIDNAENGIKRNGQAFATYRTGAQLTEAQNTIETVKGVSHLFWLRKVLREAEKDGTARLSEILNRMAKRLFVRSRMRVSVTGPVTDEWLADFLSKFPAGAPEGPQAHIGTLPKAPEGIEIPARIGFAVKVGEFDPAFAHSGSVRVAENILTYGYLWNEVRVRGGAYGTGTHIPNHGSVMFYSYRDPNPANSLEVYSGSAAFLREAAATDYENFIISTYGSALPLLTPASESARAEADWLSGSPFSEIEKVRQDILSTTPEKLLEIADMLDDVLKDAAVCVVGGPEQLKACGEKIQKFTKVF